MDILEALGLGVAAGLVGTVLMTMSQRVEMSFTGREPSTVPGQVAGRLLGRDPADDPGLEVRSAVVHWLHGISMGGVRGLLGATGLAAAPASLLFFALLWSGDALVYKVLGIADAPWRWKRADLVTDLIHKGLYAAVTSLAFLGLASTL